jgi:WD40 repeat protein
MGLLYGRAGRLTTQNGGFRRGQDKTVRIWNALTGEEVRTVRALNPEGQQQYVMSAAWSPDGSQLAIAVADRTARIYDAATGEEMLMLKGHKKMLTSVAWRPAAQPPQPAADPELGVGATTVAAVDGSDGVEDESEKMRLAGTCAAEQGTRKGKRQRRK